MELSLKYHQVNNPLHDQINNRIEAIRILEDQAQWAKSSLERIQRQINRLRAELIQYSHVMDIPVPELDYYMDEPDEDEVRAVLSGFEA